MGGGAEEMPGVSITTTVMAIHKKLLYIYIQHLSNVGLVAFFETKHAQGNTNNVY